MKTGDKNSKYILIVTCVITLFFLLFSLIMFFTPKKIFEVEKVNAREYVYFDSMAVKVNNITIQNENEKKFLVLNVTGKKISKEEDRKIFVDDIELYFDSKRLNNSIEDFKVAGKKYWNSDYAVEMDENVKVELYYEIDSKLEKLFNEGNLPQVIYSEKNYMKEINLKSNNKEVYRKIGVL